MHVQIVSPLPISQLKGRLGMGTPSGPENRRSLNVSCGFDSHTFLQNFSEPVAQGNKSATLRRSRPHVRIVPGSITIFRRRSPTGRGAWLRTKRLRVRISPSAPQTFPSLPWRNWQTYTGENRVMRVRISPAAPKARVVQLAGDGSFKNCTVQVQIPPRAPD